MTHIISHYRKPYLSLDRTDFIKDNLIKLDGKIIIEHNGSCQRPSCLPKKKFLKYSILVEEEESLNDNYPYRLISGSFYETYLL